MRQNTTEENDLISLGMNLGVYTFAKLFTEGVVPSAKAFEIMRDHCAAELEKQTGTPVEDLALLTDPTIQDMLDKIQ